MFLVVSSYQEALRSIDGDFLFFCCFLTAWKGHRALSGLSGTGDEKAHSSPRGGLGARVDVINFMEFAMCP